jgi:hypothetical protein
VMGLPIARLWALLQEFGWQSTPASQVADA